MSLLERLSWQEAKEQIKGNLVVIPTGSIEQHGPHLPLGTDYMVADAIGKLLGEESQFIVTPTIPVGFADYHDTFAGTLSVDTPVLAEYYMGIVDKLVQYGASHFLFLNAHGGNMAAISDVLYWLRQEGTPACALNWWDIVATLDPNHSPATLDPNHSPAGHADWIETSMILATDPDLAKMDIAKQATLREAPVEGMELSSPNTLEYRGVSIYIRGKTSDYTVTGNMPEAHLSEHADITIPPTAATKEIGERLYRLIVDFLLDFGEKFKEFEFEG